MNRILLVEDSKEIYQMVAQSTLKIADLFWVSSLAEAKYEIGKRYFDLIILDVDLPDGDGIEFCSSIQETHSHVSVFFLTGHSDVSKKVMGFLAGAEDYITKPFSPLELRARIEGRFRKMKQQKTDADILNWKELQINKSRQEVLVLEHNEYKKIELTALEFKILVYFAARAGIVIPREQILNDVWGDDIHVYQRSVDTHVSKLRKKLREVSFVLESVHGTGYKFSPTLLK